MLAVVRDRRDRLRVNVYTSHAHADETRSLRYENFTMPVNMVATVCVCITNFVVDDNQHTLKIDYSSAPQPEGGKDRRGGWWNSGRQWRKHHHAITCHAGTRTMHDGSDHFGNGASSVTAQRVRQIMAHRHPACVLVPEEAGGTAGGIGCLLVAYHQTQR